MIETYIKEKKDCIGCYSCANVCIKQCISMDPDEEGFLYPKVDNSICINCGMCVKSCPIINKTIVNNEPTAYACINKNEQIRSKSSSGGIFSLIAEQVLENKGIVFGAGFNEKFELEHSYIDSVQELSKFIGSKYVQSKIGDTYKQVKSFLEEGRRVVFVGTPCQIGGLKSFLNKSYEKLLCVDIICHGVPSPVVWERYLKYQEQKNGTLVNSISFRNKKNGWKLYGLSFLFENNKEYFKSSYKDLYMRAFLKDICLRPSCYECQYKTLHRQSDITLADFWGIQNLLPEMDDDKGTSLVFINTEAGRTILEKIRDKIICKRVDISQAIQYNPSAIISGPSNPKRSNFFEELKIKPINRVISKYCIDKMHVRALRLLRRIICKLVNALIRK